MPQVGVGCLTSEPFSWSSAYVFYAFTLKLKFTLSDGKHAVIYFLSILLVVFRFA